MFYYFIDFYFIDRYMYARAILIENKILNKILKKYVQHIFPLCRFIVTKYIANFYCYFKL